MKRFFNISKDCANKKYFEIDGIDNNGNIILKETIYELGNAYPFEIDELEADTQLITIGDKLYHRRGTYLIPMEYVQEISREEYIRRTLELECQYDAEKLINPQLKNAPISEFADELKQAFINKVYSVSIDSFGETPYSDFVKYACDSLIEADPNLIHIGDITDNDITLWIGLNKPGYFIGKGGEVVDFWTKRLNNILKLYHPEYTLSIRIKEIKVLAYKNCEIIL